MSFEILPVNRQILVTECDDPRLSHEQGGIDTSESRGTLGFGLVIARDQTPYIVRPGEVEPPRLAEVGDVVYFDPGVVDTLMDVGCQGRMLVHEGQIKAVVKGASVNRKDTNPGNKKKSTPTLLVPSNNLVN